MLTVGKDVRHGKPAFRAEEIQSFRNGFRVENCCLFTELCKHKRKCEGGTEGIPVRTCVSEKYIVVVAFEVFGGFGESYVHVR